MSLAATGCLEHAFPAALRLSMAVLKLCVDPSRVHEEHGECRRRGMPRAAMVCGAQRHVPMYLACIRAAARPFARKNSICTLVGHRPSTTSLPPHLHCRSDDGSCSPPRLERGNRACGWRGACSRLAGRPVRVPAVAKLQRRPSRSERRLAVHTADERLGRIGRDFEQYTKRIALGVLCHSSVSSRAVRAGNRYRKTRN